MKKILVFKKSISCGCFNIFGEVVDWKTSFCSNNGFSEDDIHVIELDEDDMKNYELAIKSIDASRVVYENSIVKVISTKLVNDKEVALMIFSPSLVS